MVIWYISKYTATPDTNGFTRPYLFSKQLVAKGHDATLIYSRSNGKVSPAFWGLSKEYDSNGVHCVKLNGPQIKTGFNIKRIISWIIFEMCLFVKMFFVSPKKPDCIIASSLSLLTFFTAVLLKKRWGCKLIVEVRDIWPDTIIDNGRFSKKNVFIRVLRWIEIFGYKNADGIISPLPRLNMYLETRIKSSFKFCFIPQGFDKQLYLSNADRCLPFRREFVVCYAGAIGKINFVEELLMAAEMLKKYDYIKFVIIGDGVLKPYLKQKYNSNKNVEFREPILKEEVPNTLAEFDLLVNMWGDFSMYKYGVSPNKWIDYMLSGVPILVAYNGFKSMINEANCGFFIEANKPDLLAEKIKEISLMDKNVLKQLGQNGQDYAQKNLDYDVLTNKLLNFIQSL